MLFSDIVEFYQAIRRTHVYVRVHADRGTHVWNQPKHSHMLSIDRQTRGGWGEGAGRWSQNHVSETEEPCQPLRAFVAAALTPTWHAFTSGIGVELSVSNINDSDWLIITFSVQSCRYVLVIVEIKGVKTLQFATKRRDDQTTPGIPEAMEWREDTRTKVLCSSCSWLGLTPLHLHPAPLPPTPPPAQLASFKWEITVSEDLHCSRMSFSCCYCCCLSLPLSLSFSVPLLHRPFFLIFLRGFFFEGVTPLNGTMQPSVKLKLLVSLELLKRGFYTCMHSYTLPYAIDIVN